MIEVISLIVILGFFVRMWYQRRDVLVHLVPLALAFPPVIAYGGIEFGWPGARLSTRVALAASLVTFAVYRLLRRDFTYYRTPALWLFAPYALVVLASVPRSVLAYNNEAGLIGNGFLSWSILVAIFLIIATSSYGEIEIRSATRLLVAVAMVTAVYSGFQALVLLGGERFVPSLIVTVTRHVRETTQFGATRIYGTLVNLGPNFYGAFVLFPTVLAFSRAFGGAGSGRLGWLFGGVVGTVVIAATYSRGAILGLAASLIALPLWRRSTRGVPLMAAAVVIVALLIANTPVGQHVGSLYVAGQLDVSASSRVNIWRGIVRSAEQHPAGLGFDGWLRESRLSEDVGLLDPQHTIWMEHPAENQWMRELADRGIAGVLALGLFFGGLIVVTFRAADPNRSAGYRRDFLAAAGAASIGWALTFLTGDHLTYDSVAGMFWYMSALALAVARDTVPQALRKDWSGREGRVRVGDFSSTGT